MTIDRSIGGNHSNQGYGNRNQDHAVVTGIEMKETEAVPGKVPNPGMDNKTDYRNRRQSRDNDRKNEARSRSSS